MNPKQTEHLSDVELRTLLTVEPDDQNLREIEQHLEECPQCQMKLEQAAAEPWWWQGGQSLFADSVQQQTKLGLHPKQENLALNKGKTNSNQPFDLLNAQVAAIVEQFEPGVHPELLGQIDGYQVESLIGIGGMGIVFKAFDSELNRSVAIKFLLPSLAQTGVARQRFLREAKAVAAICHDNVIPIYRINTSCLYPFFVMPYVGGQSLEQLVKSNGALELNQLTQIAHQVADGLAAAHSLGLVHRDIKPGNILLSNDCNRVVITDFGLVHEDGNHGLTQTGQIAGTPNYMSPEQATGQPLDGRSDLFSLGAVIYWMATGRFPFSGKNQFELLKNLQDTQPTQVRAINPEMPREIEFITTRLMAKNPNERFATASELAQFLNDYRAHLRSPLDHSTPLRETQNSSRRWLWSALTVVVVGLLLSLLPPIRTQLSNLFTGPVTPQEQDADDKKSGNNIAPTEADVTPEQLNSNIDDVPDRVKQAATKHVPGLVIISFNKRIENDNIVYVLNGKTPDGGSDWDYQIKVDDGGRIVEATAISPGNDEEEEDPFDHIFDAPDVRFELTGLDEVPNELKAKAKKLCKDVKFTRAKKAISGEVINFVLFGSSETDDFKFKFDSNNHLFEFEFKEKKQPSK